jgi:hypothetical protein
MVMTKDDPDLAREIQELEREHLGKQLSAERSPRQLQELPDAEPGSPITEEWNLFRREVQQLLSQGFKGKYALVKAGKPITIWDTLRDAVQAGEILYGSEPSLVQEVLPYLRPLRVGFNRLCRD